MASPHANDVAGCEGFDADPGKFVVGLLHQGSQHSVWDRFWKVAGEARFWINGMIFLQGVSLDGGFKPLQKN